MTEFLYPLIFSISAYFPIYFYRKNISKFLGVYDLPDGKRKIHVVPIPKTGAFSIAVIVFIFLLINFFFEIFYNYIDLNIILIFSLLIFTLGFIDDKYNLRARKKVFFLISISLTLCLFSEDLVINKFYIYTLDFFFDLGIFGLFFTIICIFTLVNSLNLADGINGLAIGLVFFWFLYINLMFENNLNLLINTLVISLILSFYHNIKSEHFLGDA